MAMCRHVYTYLQQHTLISRLIAIIITNPWKTRTFRRGSKLVQQSTLHDCILLGSPQWRTMTRYGNAIKKLSEFRKSVKAFCAFGYELRAKTFLNVAICGHVPVHGDTLRLTISC